MPKYRITLERVAQEVYEVEAATAEEAEENYWCGVLVDEDEGELKAKTVVEIEGEDDGQ